MFLVAPNGQRLIDLIHHRVEWLCLHNGQVTDERSMVEAVLADPEIIFLLEVIWDDESGRRIFDNVVDDIVRYVADDLQRRRQASMPATAG